MSNTSSDQSLSLSAAGRNFQLGMVYDAKNNKLFESLNVLKNCPKVVPKSRLCPSQILDLKSSYTIEERMEIFQFDAHMKVGVAFEFIKLGSASGKYVSDMSSSIGQSRMTLQYKQTKRYEELDTETVLRLCDNLELLKSARDQKATHFVAGMTYGNQVLMDFKCNNKRDTKHDQLDIQLKRIFSIGQFFADKCNKGNKQITLSDDIQCEIHCESKDIKKPRSFDEAIQIYHYLPTTLQNVEAVDCVHLLPLSIIDKDATKFNKSDTDEVVMNSFVHIRDDLHEHELRCDDFVKRNIDVSKIKADIQKYTAEMKQSLPSCTTPRDWKIKILQHNNSSFASGNLLERIKEEARSKTVVRRTSPICNMEFSEESESVTHMRTHEVVRRTCPICNMEFSEESEFVTHVRTHRVVRRTCPICNMEFSEESEFVTHMRTHEERMQYRCRICNHQYDTQDELWEHERITGLRDRDQEDRRNTGPISAETVYKRDNSDDCTLL